MISVCGFEGKAAVTTAKLASTMVNRQDVKAPPPLEDPIAMATCSELKVVFKAEPPFCTARGAREGASGADALRVAAKPMPVDELCPNALTHETFNEYCPLNGTLSLAVNERPAIGTGEDTVTLVGAVVLKDTEVAVTVHDANVEGLPLISKPAESPGVT